MTLRLSLGSSQQTPERRHISRVRRWTQDEAPEPERVVTWDLVVGCSDSANSDIIRVPEGEQCTSSPVRDFIDHTWRSRSALSRFCASPPRLPAPRAFWASPVRRRHPPRYDHRRSGRRRCGSSSMIRCAPLPERGTHGAPWSASPTGTEHGWFQGAMSPRVGTHLPTAHGIARGTGTHSPWMYFLRLERDTPTRLARGPWFR
jgi:hypothetical protein